ncbi:hypothetical protein [Pseudarthrobacter sp. PS3-L1]|nr:hypothetical protein [Pseudarthrobacter sp. PS3-L1]MDJ0321985.1 hypothetical protein [Pseudarthrobacter sp. PS3-L1]
MSHGFILTVADAAPESITAIEEHLEIALMDNDPKKVPVDLTWKNAGQPY